MIPPVETVPLIYFRQEGKGIKLIIKTDVEWHWEIPISQVKAADLVAQLSGFVVVGMRG